MGKFWLMTLSVFLLACAQESSSSVVGGNGFDFPVLRLSEQMTCDVTAPAVPTLEVGLRVFVSPSGDDALGKGTVRAPWRTIGRALLASSTRGALEVNAAPGTYTEELSVVASASIVRYGEGSVVVAAPTSGPYVVTITSGVVELVGIEINGSSAHNPGIHVRSGAMVRLLDVTVVKPQARGILIEDSPAYELLNVTVTNENVLLAADLAVDLVHSHGRIHNLTVADRFDHSVNVSGKGSTIVIEDSDITASPIHYADGIRLQAAMNARISGNRIFRPLDAEPASAGTLHNPPYAGIEVAAVHEGGYCVVVEQNEIEGFNVGLGVNMSDNAIVVQENLIAGAATYAVDIMWPGTEAPIIDLGGGPFESRGNNHLLGGSLAMQHNGSFDVYAQGNDWGGEASARIWDKADDPNLGEVLH